MSSTINGSSTRGVPAKASEYKSASLCDTLPSGFNGPLVIVSGVLYFWDVSLATPAYSPQVGESSGYLNETIANAAAAARVLAGKNPEPVVMVGPTPATAVAMYWDSLALRYKASSQRLEILSPIGPSRRRMALGTLLTKTSVDTRLVHVAEGGAGIVVLRYRNATHNGTALDESILTGIGTATISAAIEYLGRRAFDAFVYVPVTFGGQSLA
jgi:hypothetical protein